MKNIATHLSYLRQQITDCCKQHQRPPQRVCLLAVSKTRSVAEIEQAIAAKQCHFAENQLQEALPKINALSKHNLTWHFIGQIQRNKTRDIATHFSWVHSVDRAIIAQRLSEQRPVHLPPLNICLQVNIDAELQKAGVNLAQLPALVESVQALPNLRLRGLMTVPKRNNPNTQQTFAALHNAYEQLRQQGIPLDSLSMGMSHDWQLAIAEGATLIRLGRAIFGERQ